MSEQCDYCDELNGIFWCGAIKGDCFGGTRISDLSRHIEDKGMIEMRESSLEEFVRLCRENKVGFAVDSTLQLLYISKYNAERGVDVHVSPSNTIYIDKKEAIEWLGIVKEIEK